MATTKAPATSADKKATPAKKAAAKKAPAKKAASASAPAKAKTKAPAPKRAAAKKAPTKRKVTARKTTSTRAKPGPKPGTRRGRPKGSATRRRKLTGGSSDYYKVKITRPTTAKKPYVAECNDIIESLNLNWAEANIFKAIWRRAAARMGNGKPGIDEKYDMEKMEFFMGRLKVNG